MTMSGVNAGVGTSITTKAFIMIMIGGAGVVAGSIFGAVVLGFGEAIGYALLPGSVTYLVIFLALIIFLVVRPRGIMEAMGLTTSGIRSPEQKPANVKSAGLRRHIGWSATTRSIIRRVAPGVGTVAILLLIEPMLLKGNPDRLGVATNANILGLGALGLWLMFAIGLAMPTSRKARLLQ